MTPFYAQLPDKVQANSKDFCTFLLQSRGNQVGVLIASPGYNKNVYYLLSQGYYSRLEDFHR